MAEVLMFPESRKATSMAPAPLDAAARASALDVTRSWVVEAPAGSGKTGLIIQRYLKLLSHESVDDPGQVLAVTFTRKATFELRDRVLAQLEGVVHATPATGFDAATRPLAEAVLARDRERGWNLLEQPRRLNIRTIDSVCSEIAGSLPVLSRSGGASAPSEDADIFYAEAARRATSMLGGSDTQLNDSLERVLLHRDGNLRDTESLIANMLAWRDQWGELVPLGRAELDDVFLDEVVLPRLERTLDLAICTALTRIARTLPADVLDELCELAAEMGHLDGYDGNPSPLALCAGKSMPPEEKASHLSHWNALIDLLLTKEGTFRKPTGLRTNTLKFMVEATHRKQLSSLIDRVRHDDSLRDCLCDVRNLPPAQYPQDQWVVAKALFRVLSRALVELQVVFAERGECDFAEVGLLARAALRHEGAHEALKLAQGHALQHLLIDEMQDTSSSQYELIELLTEGWDGSGQTVFLVGDPKQSIYLFRQARVERFIRTMKQERLGGLELGVLHLSSNFRSQANLVRDFNNDFSKIFPAVTDPVAPELVTYRAADAVLPPTAAAARQWHTAVLPYTRDSQTDRKLRQRQRREFGAEIREIAQAWRTRTSHDKPARMAVLVRSRTHLLEIVEAFKNPACGEAIPYRAVQVEPLSEGQEVLDLVALTRALQHPADRAAWLALLRSPFCGLTLADLHRLAGGDEDSLGERTIFELISERGDLLSEDGVARLQPFWSVLSAAQAQRGLLRLSQWVDRTFRAFNGYSFVGQEARANIVQFLHLLDDLELPGGTVDLAHLQRQLGKLYAAPSVHPGSVDLMTIHGSKGLEWDVVFVPALERSGRSDRGRLLTWLELDQDPEHDDPGLAHGILAPIQSTGAESHALSRWMRGIESGREAAERKRLFYVACTRAREELHLFASPQLGKDELRPAPGSLLASAWPAAADEFDASARMIELPLTAEPAVLDRLAAQARPERNAKTVQRIPLAHLPVAAPSAMDSDNGHKAYDRPEGSFTARAFGNAVHAFLDQCASRLACGVSVEALLLETKTWTPRVAAVLRANGLAADEVRRQTAGVLECLRHTLEEPAGRWILSPHVGSKSESALIAWSNQRSSLRLDRTFMGSAEPLEPGSDHLWIVDFKTSTHRGRDLGEFLEQHRTLYAPQLEFYARQLSAHHKLIRLALYYPRISALDWWEPTGL